MEFLVFLLLLAGMKYMATQALSRGKASRGLLAPSDIPIRVHWAVRRKAPGIRIRSVRVVMAGARAVRYHVAGTLPDGRAVEVSLTDGDEDLDAGAVELPHGIRERLSQCLPSFVPTPGRMRLVRRDRSEWYEMDGVLAEGLPVGVKISLDGHDLLMTVSDNKS